MDLVELFGMEAPQAKFRLTLNTAPQDGAVGARHHGTHTPGRDISRTMPPRWLTAD